MAFMGMMNTTAPNTQQMNLARSEGYQAFMNPDTYLQWMNLAAYTMPGALLLAILPQTPT
jgi:hypothetical protein